MENRPAAECRTASRAVAPAERSGSGEASPPSEGGPTRICRSAGRRFALRCCEGSIGEDASMPPAPGASRRVRSERNPFSGALITACERLWTPTFRRCDPRRGPGCGAPRRDTATKQGSGCQLVPAGAGRERGAADSPLGRVDASLLGCQSVSTNRPRAVCSALGGGFHSAT